MPDEKTEIKRTQTYTLKTSIIINNILVKKATAFAHFQCYIRFRSAVCLNHQSSRIQSSGADVNFLERRQRMLRDVLPPWSQRTRSDKFNFSVGVNGYHVVAFRGLHPLLGVGFTEQLLLDEEVAPLL